MEFLFWLPWMVSTIVTCGLLIAASRTSRVRRQGQSKLLVCAALLILVGDSVSIIATWLLPLDLFLHDTTSLDAMWEKGLALQLVCTWLFELPYCAALLIAAYAALKSPPIPHRESFRCSDQPQS